VIPVLKGLLEHPKPYVRQEVAATVLILGDGDAALPVLEQLVDNEGYSSALYQLFKGPGKIIDERGYRIVSEALGHEKAEVRMHAVKILNDAGKMNDKDAEEKAYQMLMELKDKKRNDYELQARESSDARACENAVGMLSRFKTKKALPIIKGLLESNIKSEGYVYVCSYGLRTAVKSMEGEDNK
jgi:HEAT repeat protein